MFGEVWNLIRTRTFLALTTRMCSDIYQPIKRKNGKITHFTKDWKNLVEVPKLHLEKIRDHQIGAEKRTLMSSLIQHCILVESMAWIMTDQLKYHLKKSSFKRSEIRVPSLETTSLMYFPQCIIWSDINLRGTSAFQPREATLLEDSYKSCRILWQCLTSWCNRRTCFQHNHEILSTRTKKSSLFCC